jgi:4-hydroxy-tetrahydrodipicolinate synthase
LDFRGLYVPLATPFGPDGAVNERELRRLIGMIAPYVDGFVPNGTTGDFPLLSPEERLRILNIVVDEVGGDKRIIAGTGAIATTTMIELAQTARDAGADAALVVKPYYVRPTASGLREHFMAAAKAMPDFPFLLYNFPKLMGQEIPVEVVGSLTQACENVVGMKDSSGQLP